MIRTVLIDDENHFLVTLEAMLDSQSDISVEGTANGVSSGVEIIRNVNPDLVFLDVQMEDGTGFDLLKQLEDRDFQLIFITAHNHYAVEAFRFSAIDYLLKPLVSSNLFEALERVRHSQATENLSSQINALIDNVSTLTKDKRKIVLKESDAIHIVPIDEIMWCSAEGSYCTFNLDDGRQITISHNLREYDILLSESGFFRIHRSYLVNMGKARKFDRADGGTLLLENGTALPVSVRKRESLMEALSRI